jgi:O-antigen ligase
VHVEHQPGVTIGAAGATLHVALSDLAALAIVAAGAAVAARSGISPLRATWPVWAAAAAVLVWIGLATVYPLLRLDAYPFAEHAVTAAGAAEYALLAPAAALLLRSAGDVHALLSVLVAWAAVAAAVALAQFLGAPILGAWPAGFRQPSFLGHHDLAMLAGAAFVTGLASAALGRPHLRRPLVVAALVAGGLGLVLAASVAALAGVALALAAVGLLAARERAALPGVMLALAASATVAVGVLALRGGDVADFLRFARPAEVRDERPEDVDTYAHRAVIAYIGWRIFREHPAVGAGWQASTEPEVFEPHLSAAGARFPDAPSLAFPARDRPHGVQNAYVQALADLGLVGAGLFAALFGAAAAASARAARADPSGAAAAGLLWTLVALGVWSAQGLVVGIPMLALTSVGIGLAALGAARAREAAA